MRRFTYTYKEGDEEITSEFSYTPFEEFEEDKKLLPAFVEYKESGYIDIGAAFDIETTNFYSKKYKKPLATMWHWQFGIDEMTITGRTWSQWLELIEYLNERATLSGKTLLVWIQNASFEFQFIKGLLSWKRKEDGSFDIFAKSDRDIIYFKYGNIEFRDSLVLTQMPLKKFKKNFNTKVGKLSGDLDYKLKRTWKTKTIKNSEMAYNINDVQVLTSFFHSYIKPFFLDQGFKIPLTATGIVREEMKRNFKECDPAFKKKYRKKIRYAMPTRELYNEIRQYGFRGGLTHANTSACNDLMEETLHSLDLKSAHPSHELQDKMPMRYVRKNKKYWDIFVREILADYENQGFFGCFRFHNIRASGWHCLESKNKLVNYSDDCIFENGRLASGSWIEVCLMELDFLNYIDMYEFDVDKTECLYIYTCEKEYLPDFMRKTICHYFYIKENMPKDSMEYAVAKRKLNSTFGFCATGLVEAELQYNPATKQFEPSNELKTYESLTNNLLLLPQWGMAIAAGSRRDIVRALKATGCDSIYYDTDSDKVRHYEQYKDWFDKFNNEKIAKNEAMDIYGYDINIFRRLGTFEHEYETDPNGFMVLGAKRYICKHGGEVSVTIAGMRKGSLEAYCEKNNLNIFEQFRASLPEGYKKKTLKVLELSKEDSGKTTTVYTDETIEDTLVDYEGVEAEIHEESCVAIIDIPFKLNVEREFLEWIISRKNERDNQIYKGIL